MGKLEHLGLTVYCKKYYRVHNDDVRGITFPQFVAPPFGSLVLNGLRSTPFWLCEPGRKDERAACLLWTPYESEVLFSLVAICATMWTVCATDA
jgi:hypothetical protein